MAIRTNPCIILVRSVARETVIINKDNPKSSIDLLLIPNIILISAITKAMKGILRPMLARAEPKAKLRLV